MNYIQNHRKGIHYWLAKTRQNLEHASAEDKPSLEQKYAAILNKLTYMDKFNIMLFDAKADAEADPIEEKLSPEAESGSIGGFPATRLL